MDVYVVIRGLPFVWDSRKASTNLSKHKVSFERACEVFFDPLIAYEDASVTKEQRLAAIGKELTGQLLYVVHVTWKTDEYA